MDEKREIRNHVSDKTPVSLGLTLIMLGGVVSGVFYVASSMARVDGVAVREDKLETYQEQHQDEYNRELTKIEGRLSRIEAALKIRNRRGDND